MPITPSVGELTGTYRNY